jgi:WD40 repeat protein
MDAICLTLAKDYWFPICNLGPSSLPLIGDCPQLNLFQTCTWKVKADAVGGDRRQAYRFLFKFTRSRKTISKPGGMHTGVLASGGEDGIICVWDIKSGQTAAAGPTATKHPPQLIFQHAGHRSPVTSPPPDIVVSTVTARPHGL